MAREHARIWLDINSDDEFEALPFDAQGLYTRVILTLDDLSYCGVATWRPRKLTTKAPDLTYPRILAAASALEGGRYCLFDLDTEEVLVRSFIRRDQLLRNPKYAAAVVRTYSGIASKVLRAAVVTEVRRVRAEHPEYSSWTAKDKTTDIGAELARLMAKPDLDTVPYTDQIPTEITNGQTVNIGNPDPVEIANAQTVQIANPDNDGLATTDRSGFPSPSPSPSHPHPSGGYETGERHQGDPPDPNDPPPRHCPRHMPSGTLDRCGACADARRQHDRWLATLDIQAKAALQTQAREEAARRIAEATTHRYGIESCELCDDDGYLPGSSTVCDHVDRTETTRNGMAAVRAALRAALRQPHQLDQEDQP